MVKLVLPLLLAALASPAWAQTPVRWITLGTSGGPSVQTERAQIANALVVGQSVYLFDAGNDVQRQLARAGIAERNVKAVFLSHHHLDHNADLGPLIITHWLFGQGRLAVTGPAGTRSLALGLARANAPTALASFPTMGAAKPPIEETITPSDLPDITEPKVIYEDGTVRISAISVEHYQVPPSVALPQLPKAVAYRVEAGGRTLVYSGDTGPSPGLEQLARGADVLFTEVVDLAGIAAELAKSMAQVPAPVRANVVAGMKANHLTADEIGRLAQKAGVRRVVLTHFVPSPDKLRDPSALVRGVRKSFKGPVKLARDLAAY